MNILKYNVYQKLKKKKLKKLMLDISPSRPSTMSRTGKMLEK